MPHNKALINSFVATMTIFQITYQESQAMIFLNEYFYHDENQKQGIETTLLQNGLFIFGCCVGTYIAGLLQNQSNKFIFLLSDLINFFANFDYYLNFYTWPGGPQAIRLDIYICTRIFIAIAQGINYTQACIYIKQISKKTKKGYLFFLIPFQLQGGITLGCLEGNQLKQMYRICQFATVIRMILLIILNMETPSYYFFVKQNIKATKDILAQIHDDREIEKEIIDSFREQQKSQNSEILSKQQMKKYFLCIALVIITQLSGFNIFNIYYFSFIQLWYFPSNFGIGNYFTGLFIIFCLMLFTRKRSRSYQILVGQFTVCLGLAIFSFTYEQYYLQGLAIFFLTLGYYIGLGSLIFQIIPVLLPERGIIDCLNAQWILNLTQMCVLGIFYNKSQNNEEYLVKFIDIAKLYFYFSCFALLFLFFLLRVLIITNQDRQKVEAKNENSLDNTTRIELASNQIQ